MIDRERTPIPPPYAEYNILGSKVTSITIADLLRHIATAIREHGRDLILNTNVHGINLAYKEPWLREFRNGAHIVYCDGAGVVIGARLLGYRLPSRITMADWIWDLAAFCEHNGFSLFFLGAKPGRAEVAARTLKARYPRLKILGTHHGYFEKSGPENDRVIDMINSARPNLLIVGFGMPQQERWLMANYSRVHANAFFAQGAIFDFISGAVPRCPRWLGSLGFEWLFRLCLEPRRMFARYVIGNPVFLYRVLRELLSKSV